jgi:hypothetical protein
MAKRHWGIVDYTYEFTWWCNADHTPGVANVKVTGSNVRDTLDAPGVSVGYILGVGYVMRSDVIADWSSEVDACPSREEGKKGKVQVAFVWVARHEGGLTVGPTVGAGLGFPLLSGEVHRQTITEDRTVFTINCCSGSGVREPE